MERNMSYTQDQLKSMLAKIQDSDKAVYYEHMNSVKNFLESRKFQYTVEDKENYGNIIVEIPKKNNFLHFVLRSKHIILATKNSPNVHLNATDFLWIDSQTKSRLSFNSIKHWIIQVDINYSYKELMPELIKKFDEILMYMLRDDQSCIRETQSNFLVPRYDKKHNIMHWLKTENDKKQELKQRADFTKNKHRGRVVKEKR